MGLMDLEEQVATLREVVDQFNNQVADLKAAFAEIEAEHEMFMSQVSMFREQIRRTNEAVEHMAEMLARHWKVPLADVLWR